MNDIIVNRLAANHGRRYCVFSDRASGKTTALMLGAIADAMRSPGVPQDINDHQQMTEPLKEHFCGVINNMLNALNLKYFNVNRQDMTITYDVFYTYTERTD